MALTWEFISAQLNKCRKWKVLTAAGGRNKFGGNKAQLFLAVAKISCRESTRKNPGHFPPVICWTAVRRQVINNYPVLSYFFLFFWVHKKRERRGNETIFAASSKSVSFSDGNRRCWRPGFLLNSCVLFKISKSSIVKKTAAKRLSVSKKNVFTFDLRPVVMAAALVVDSCYCWAARFGTTDWRTTHKSFPFTFICF